MSFGFDDDENKPDSDPFGYAIVFMLGVFMGMIIAAPILAILCRG